MFHDDDIAAKGDELRDRQDVTDDEQSMLWGVRLRQKTNIDPRPADDRVEVFFGACEEFNTWLYRTRTQAEAAAKLKQGTPGGFSTGYAQALADVQREWVATLQRAQAKRAAAR